MATSSITHNFVITSPQSVENFVSAVEEARVYNKLCKGSEKKGELRKMPEKKFGFSNEILDSMLEGVESQEDLLGKSGLITQLTKSLLERMLEPV